ncbi:MAG: acetyl-CoA hydrolase/transferase family protein [Chloroflexi bacterium]|nr:acetyl-CoA hydrolase/transferase family protein [Chloroflexota bacterium]
MTTRETAGPRKWQEEYQRKLTTPEEAVKVVKSGDTVVIPLGREPEALGFALAARAGELRDIDLLVNAPGLDFGWYDPGWEESFRVAVAYVFPRGVSREFMDARRGDFLIQSVFGAPWDLPEEPTDVVMVEVSPPDRNGFCSFGTSLWDKREQCARARVVLAEVNDRLIRTHGTNYVHVSEIDAFVEHSRSSGWGYHPPAPSEEVRTIARFVNELIRDGDTIQFGTGTISEALPNAGALDGKNDLGLHTEMTARGLVRLVREGAINGKRKTIHPGKAIATALGGAREDVEFIHENPLFEAHSVHHVSHPRTICQNDNMVAVNQALAIDLTGQVASESFGPRMWSGSGGQPAFAIGSLMAKNGRSIMVLPSTAKGDTISRIIPVHDAGTVITVPRTAADVVITEHGVARLRGRTIRERAEALIAIAHPDHRAELRRQARKLYWE